MKCGFVIKKKNIGLLHIGKPIYHPLIAREGIPKLNKGQVFIVGNGVFSGKRINGFPVVNVFVPTCFLTYGRQKEKVNAQ